MLSAPFSRTVIFISDLTFCMINPARGIVAFAGKQNVKTTAETSRHPAADAVIRRVIFLILACSEAIPTGSASVHRSVAVIDGPTVNVEAGSLLKNDAVLHIESERKLTDIVSHCGAEAYASRRICAVPESIKTGKSGAAIRFEGRK